MPNQVIPFVEWFNINNRAHLKALETFLKSSEWPQFFVPRDVSNIPESIGDELTLSLLLKIVHEWIKRGTAPIQKDELDW